MRTEAEWYELLAPCDRGELLRVRHLVEQFLGDATEGEAPEPEPRPGREVVETRQVGGVTLQREKVRCGKPNCKSCPHPQGNGGYWYAYYRAGGKVKSRYVGKSASQAEAFAARHAEAGGRVGGKAAAELR